MLDHDSFLAAIWKAPEENLPRLIYADYLDERNDPLGQFIRIQCALEDCTISSSRRWELRQFEAEYLSRYGTIWAKPLEGLVTGYAFRRGFIEMVRMEARTFLARAPLLFQLAPVRHIQFLDLGSSAEKVFHSSWLHQLSTLTIYAQHGGAQLGNLLENISLPRLTTFNLGRNSLGSLGLRYLMRSEGFPALETLYLHENEISDSGTELITRSKYFPKLKRLHLEQNDLTSRTLAYLALAQKENPIQEIYLARNQLHASPKGQSNLLLPELCFNKLHLKENQLSAESLNELIQPGHPGHIRYLSLSHNRLRYEAIEQLLSCLFINSLEVLDLEENWLNDEAVRLIAQSDKLKYLTWLNLDQNPIHEGAVLSLLENNTLTALKWLKIPKLGIDPYLRQELSKKYTLIDTDQPNSFPRRIEPHLPEGIEENWDLPSRW